jgi:hypothetical protein
MTAAIFQPHRVIANCEAIQENMTCSRIASGIAFSISAAVIQPKRLIANCVAGKQSGEKHNFHPDCFNLRLRNDGCVNSTSPRHCELQSSEAIQGKT